MQLADFFAIDKLSQHDEELLSSPPCSCSRS